MKRWQTTCSVLMLGVSVALMQSASADNRKDQENVRARLIGLQEVPSVLTKARGWFRAKIERDRISFSLSYEKLQGAVTQAHLHIGQHHANGGISVWLCGNPNPSSTPPLAPPPGTQTCPASPATIEGTITPEMVVGPTGQGISPGEFADLLTAIRAGVVYANVHSTLAPGGEIRGQVL